MKITLYFPYVMVFFSVGLLAQDVKFNPKVLSFRNERVAIGLGLEMSGQGLMKFNGAPKEAKVRFENPFDTSKTPFYNYSLDIDLYSPNSIIGLWSSIGYSKNYFYIQGKNDNADLFYYDKLEVPLYLKLRTGQRNGNLHAWFAAGGSYNISLNCTRKYYFSTQSGYIKDQNRKQLRNTFSLGGLIGFEIVNIRKENYAQNYDTRMGKIRFFMFGRFNYYFQDILNADYNLFKVSNSRSAICDYQDFNFKYFVASIGIKIFYKIPKKLPK
jgi:hypothetical protein